MGKAGEVADAIRKGGDFARSQMVSVSLKGATIPHEVFSHYGGAKVLLRPASPGTGIIAGKTVRAVLERSEGAAHRLEVTRGSSFCFMHSQTKDEPAAGDMPCAQPASDPAGFAKPAEISGLVQA